MKKNLKSLFMLTALLVLLVGLTAVNAADINDNSTSQTISHVTVQDTSSIEEVSAVESDNKLQSNMDKKVVKKESRTVNNKKIC